MSKILFGIAGPAGSGKDTSADYLVSKHGFVKLTFAGPLKAGLAAMGMAEPANREDKEKAVPGFGFTWRQAAQTLGTEWGRSLDADLWLKLTMLEVDKLAKNVVISDVRFENEAAAIRKAGGTIIHLYGRKVDLGTNSKHASEQSLMFYPAQDELISNESSIDDLYTTLESILNVR